MDALIHGFTAGGFDGLQPVIGHAAQDLDHLPVAIIAALQLASDRGHGGWKHPVLERSPITQRAGFACQHRHIMPRIIDRLASPEGAGMFTDYHTILPDDDAFGIGMHINRTANGSRQDRVFVAVEPDCAGLGYRGGHAVEAIEGAEVGNKVRPLGLKHLLDRLVGLFHMAVRLRIGHALVQQPGVQLVKALHP